MKVRSSSSYSSGGGGIVTTVQIVFIVLKLVGLVDWSWVWVLAPTWISTIFMAIFLGILLLPDIIMDWRLYAKKSNRHPRNQKSGESGRD